MLTGKALKLELHTHLRQCQSILTKPLVGQKMADGLAREYYQHGHKSGFEWQVNFWYMTLLWRDHYQPSNIPVLNRCFFFAGPNVYLRWSQSLHRSFVKEDLHGFLPSGLLCLCCAKRRHEDQRRRGTPTIFCRPGTFLVEDECVCVCLTGCSATLHGENVQCVHFFQISLISHRFVSKLQGPCKMYRNGIQIQYLFQMFATYLLFFSLKLLLTSPSIAYDIPNVGRLGRLMRRASRWPMCFLQSGNLSNSILKEVVCFFFSGGLCLLLLVYIYIQIY